MRWSDIDRIVEVLEDMYAEEDIPEHDIEYLREMVLSIPEFEDHEEEVDDDQLKLIIESWLELRNEASDY